MSNLIERLRERVRMLATPAGGDMVVKLFPKEVMEVADALEAKDAEIERLQAVVDAANDYFDAEMPENKATFEDNYWTARAALEGGDE